MFSSPLFQLLIVLSSLLLGAGSVVADSSNTISVSRTHHLPGVCFPGVDKPLCISNTLGHADYCRVWLNYCNPPKVLANEKDRATYAAYCSEAIKQCPFKPKDGAPLGGNARGHRRGYDSRFDFNVRADSTGSLAPDNLDVDTSDNVWYAVEITLGGQNFTVQLDTGSSDLWLFARDRPMQLTNTTDLLTSETYGQREVQGSIQFAELQIGNFVIESQAFLDVIEKHDFDLRGYDGILGMAFDIGSIHAKVQAEWGAKAADGLALSPMTALFAQNMSLSNNFDVQLSRPKTELSDTGDGLLVISSHAAGFENVTGAPKLSRVAPEHWSVVMDEMLINGQSFSFNQSRVAGAPPGKIVAALDTGSLLSALPPAAVDAIYGSVPGAVYDNVTEAWLVPCDRSPNLTFVFSGQSFPMHPLDLTFPIINTLPINDQWDTHVTECINAFQYLASDPTSSDGFDIILADAFLHNTYASFNYGGWHPTNGTQDLDDGPFVQMTSTTDSTTMWDEFRAARAASLAQLPLPLDPASIVRLRYEGSSASPPADSTNIPASSTADRDGDSDVRAELSGVAASTASGEAPSSDKDDSDGWGSKYGTTVLALLAANLLVGLGLLVAALAMWVRRRRGSVLADTAATPCSVAVLLKEPTEATRAYHSIANSKWRNFIRKAFVREDLVGNSSDQTKAAALKNTRIAHIRTPASVVKFKFALFDRRKKSGQMVLPQSIRSQFSAKFFKVEGDKAAADDDVASEVGTESFPGFAYNGDVLLGKWNIAAENAGSCS